MAQLGGGDGKLKLLINFAHFPHFPTIQPNSQASYFPSLRRWSKSNPSQPTPENYFPFLRQLM